jgi:hypothetical protein
MTTNRFATEDAFEQAARVRLFMPAFAFTTTEANFTSFPLIDLTTAAPGTTSAGALVSDTSWAALSPVPDLGGSMYISALNYASRESSGYFYTSLGDWLWTCSVDITTNNASPVDVSGIDFSGRLPKKPDDITPIYNTLELYAVYVSTPAQTGAPNLTIGYVDGNGNSKTATVSLTGTQRGRSILIPTDGEGISAISNYQVTSGVATAGTLRLVLIRPLVGFQTAPKIIPLTWLDTGLPQIFPDSALINVSWAPGVQGIQGPAGKGYTIEVRAA